MTINFTSSTICYFIEIYAFQVYKRYKDHNTHLILFWHNRIYMDIFVVATSLSNYKLLFCVLISSLLLMNFFVSIIRKVTMDTPTIFNQDSIPIGLLWKMSFMIGVYVKAICNKIITMTPRKINLFEKNPILKTDLVRDLQLNI